MSTSYHTWAVYIDPDPDDYDARLEVRYVRFDERKTAKEVEGIITKALVDPYVVHRLHPHYVH